MNIISCMAKMSYIITIHEILFSSSVKRELQINLSGINNRDES